MQPSELRGRIQGTFDLAERRGAALKPILTGLLDLLELSGSRTPAAVIERLDAATAASQANTKTLLGLANRVQELERRVILLEKELSAAAPVADSGAASAADPAGQPVEAAGAPQVDQSAPSAGELSGGESAPAAGSDLFEE